MKSIFMAHFAFKEQFIAPVGAKLCPSQGNKLPKKGQKSKGNLLETSAHIFWWCEA